MSVGNPYERRQSPKDRAQSWGHDLSSVSLPVGPRSSPMHFRDIEALIYSAHLRGYEERAVDDAGDHRVELHEAWEQGHTVGENDGRREQNAEMLQLLEERYSARLNEHAGKILEMTENLANVTKADLVEQMSGTHGLLDELIHDHHAGFPPDLPF